MFKNFLIVAALVLCAVSCKKEEVAVDAECDGLSCDVTATAVGAAIDPTADVTATK